MIRLKEMYEVLEKVRSRIGIAKDTCRIVINNKEKER